MALPFQLTQRSKRTKAVAVDLGTQQTKAVFLQRKGDSLVLAGVSVCESPVMEKNFSTEGMGDHLRQVLGELPGKQRQVTLVLGANDSLLRHAELPMIPISEMRQMLKYNAKNYLQQELPDYVFECQVLPAREKEAVPAEGGARKARVLVGGAKRQLLQDYQSAAKAAGVVAQEVMPGLVGGANALELAEPETFQKEVVAMVDLGFRNSTISVIGRGELALSRVVAIGGDKLTSGLAETLNISYPEAEQMKLQVPDEVQAIVQALLMPLGRELRASIDFFEHQQDRTVTQVLLSGGGAKSAFILETLQTELMVPCRVWNPVGFLELGLPPEQVARLEQNSPLLGTAVGAAVAVF